MTAAAARVLIHTYQHLYEHLPTGLEIELSSVTGMQQHLPTYLLKSLNQLLRAQEKCTSALDNQRTNFEIPLFLHSR